MHLPSETRLSLALEKVIPAPRQQVMEKQNGGEKMRRDGLTSHNLIGLEMKRGTV